MMEREAVDNEIAVPIPSTKAIDVITSIHMTSKPADLLLMSALISMYGKFFMGLSRASTARLIR